MEENKKYLRCATGNSLRALVQFVNNEGIPKEDLVRIAKDGDQYTVLYYK
jgi:bisphosphoglycerate-dependent phosphoglycerate mutase